MLVYSSTGYPHDRNTLKQDQPLNDFFVLKPQYKIIQYTNYSTSHFNCHNENHENENPCNINCCTLQLPYDLEKQHFFINPLRAFKDIEPYSFESMPHHRFNQVR